MTTRPTWVRWRVLILLVLASFISYILRYNMSAATPTIIAEFNLTEIQFGWILGAFTLGYAIFQFPGGVLVSAIGARRTLTWAMVLWGLLTIITVAIPHGDSGNTTVVILSFIVIRFLVGACHAPLYPLTGGVVERWFPVGGWALPNGLSSSGLGLGTAVAATSLAWMIGQYGWRPSFIMIAPLGFFGAALWWWYVRDNPADHEATNTEEVELIYANRPEAVASSEESPAWLRVLRNRDTLLLMFSYFCMNYVFFLFFNWVSYYLETIRAFGAQEAGFVTSFQWIAAAFGATLGGFLCDGLSRRIGLRNGCRLPAMAGLCLSGLFLVIGAVSGNPYVAATFLAMSFFFNQITEAAFWAAAIGVGGRYAAASCGVMNTGGNLVGFVGALLVPVTAKYFGWTVAMSSGALFALVGAVAWMFIRADRPIAE